MLSKPEFWRAIIKGVGGQTRQKQYVADRDNLIAQGSTGDEAFAILAGPGGKYSKWGCPELAPSPSPSVEAAVEDGAMVDGTIATPAATHAPSSAPPSKASVWDEQQAEKAKQRPFKDKLCADADSKQDHREWVQWAARWQAIVRRDDGIILWDLVTGDHGRAPHPGAVFLLEQACVDPEKFVDTLHKTLGKSQELGDDMLQRERKREEDLVRRLQEVDAEIALHGDAAYA